MRLKDKWKSDQLRWATERGCSADTKGYVSSLALNLLQPMSSGTEAEFSRGSGGELRANLRSGRPKMHALHSSSVLACNVFDYWRVKELGPMGQALGTASPIARLTFEAQFPTGLPGNPPNIDVALWLRSGDVWAIESKFTEPFGNAKSGAAFKDKYFPAGRPIWNDLSLRRCGALAIALQKGRAVFRHLDSAQLLKHALGLHVNHPRCFTLVYLYADHDGQEGQQHLSEIGEFEAAVAGDFPFVPLSYTTFLKKLHALAGTDHESYFEYIAKRYGFVATKRAPAGD